MARDAVKALTGPPTDNIDKHRPAKQRQSAAEPPQCFFFCCTAEQIVGPPVCVAMAV